MLKLKMASLSNFCSSDTVRLPASAGDGAAFPLRNSSLFVEPPELLAGRLLVPVHVCEGKALQLITDLPVKF